jgi:hypothetical protein
MEAFTGFQATGYQVIGGARLTVLRATDPSRLTRRALLPAVFTSGQPVTSLEVWVDGQRVCAAWPPDPPSASRSTSLHPRVISSG